MKLNKLEFFLMNNPLRALIQEHYELKIFKKMASIKKIDIALEIGCGNGNGTGLIKKYFNPNKIIAIDLDEKMIDIAQRKNTDASIIFKVMDASNLDFPNNHFDAIFDFGIIHHIPNWKDCLTELKRVIKKDGELILEELSLDTFSGFPGRFWESLLSHPYEQMFSTDDFIQQLKDVGFTINRFRKSNPMKMIKHFSLTAKG